MTVKEALDKIYAPKGVTSIIEGLINNDFSVLDNQKGTEASFDFANLRIKELQIQLDNCHSDWSWWSILGDLEYWKAAKNILEAGMIHSGELADVEAPNLQDCVVMDAISRVTKFGEKVLSETKLKFKNEGNR